MLDEEANKFDPWANSSPAWIPLRDLADFAAKETAVAPSEVTNVLRAAIEEGRISHRLRGNALEGADPFSLSSAFCDPDVLPLRVRHSAEWAAVKWREGTFNGHPMEVHREEVQTVLSERFCSVAARRSSQPEPQTQSEQPTIAKGDCHQWLVTLMRSPEYAARAPKYRTKAVLLREAKAALKHPHLGKTEFRNAYNAAVAETKTEHLKLLGRPPE